MALIVIGSIFGVLTATTIFLIIRGLKYTDETKVAAHIVPALFTGLAALTVLVWFFIELNSCLACIYGHWEERNIRWGYYSGCQVVNVRVEK